MLKYNMDTKRVNSTISIELDTVSNKDYHYNHEAVYTIYLAQYIIMTNTMLIQNAIELRKHTS